MQLKLNLYVFFVFLILGTQLQAQKNYSLQQALQLAKENSPYLKAAQYDISIEKTAKLRPNLSLNNEYIQLMRTSHFSENTSWHNGQNREMFWELSKPFQLAGQRKHKIDAANKAVLLAERSYEEVERNLFLEVAN